MDEGELSMDQAKELTAKYICENEEWLKIALHVYDAKDAVRWRLIEQIWQGVEKRILDKIDGIDQHIAQYNGFSFVHEDMWNFWIYAEVEQGRWPAQKLIVGIYLADEATLDVTRRKEIRQCYDAAFDKQCSSKGQYLVIDNVGQDRQLHRWDSEEFLREAIIGRDAIESYLADLLEKTFRDIERDMKRIAKDVWG